MLRVIGGTLRGRKFLAPTGRNTRPTGDRVRESIFDLLGPIEPGGRVLDLYAGSGALGIEALSRGAGLATFIERDRSALTALRSNLRSLGLQDASTVVVADVLDERREPPGGPFDWIFADPPYGEELATATLRRAVAWMSDDGILTLESGGKDEPPELPEGLALWKSRRYGASMVSLFARTTEESQ